jgi:hypothetical protein
MYAQVRVYIGKYSPLPGRCLLEGKYEKKGKIKIIGAKQPLERSPGYHWQIRGLAVAWLKT